MEREDIIQAVNSIFMERFELDASELTPEKNIVTDLELDSLDIVDMIVGLQQKFGIMLRDNKDIRSVKTLGDVYDVFEKLITENGKYPLEELLKELSEEDRKVLRQFIRFEPLPFVKRVVFIAVPHKGSAMARSWIGRFGARLVRLPRRLLDFRQDRKSVV